MFESVGINGEVRVLDEFVCTAICHDVSQMLSAGRGESAGFRVSTATETFCESSSDGLRQLSTPQLCSLVTKEGFCLPRDTLKLIHDIALERLNSDQTCRDQTAGALSNIVMEQAVARIVASAT